MRYDHIKKTGTAAAAAAMALLFGGGAGAAQAQTTTPQQNGAAAQGVTAVLAKAAAMRAEAEARAYYGGGSVRTNYSAAAGSLQRLQTLLGGAYSESAAPPADRAEAQQDVNTLWEAAKNARAPRRASELRRAAQLYASAATRYFRASDREGRLPVPPQEAVAQAEGAPNADATTGNAATDAAGSIDYPQAPVAVYAYPQFVPYTQQVTPFPVLNGPQLFNYGPQFGAQVITIGPQGYGGYLPGFRVGLF